MLAAIATAVNAVRPAIIASAPYVARVTPYVVTAAKVSAAIALVNFGTRMGLRGGANYLRHQQNEETLNKVHEEVKLHPEMTKEEFNKLSEGMPGLRKTTLKEKFEFLWDATWTSAFTGVGTFYATLTWPLYGAAWLLRYTGNTVVWLGLRFGRVLGVAPWTERSYNERTQTATRRFYYAVRKPTLGLAERFNLPYVKATLWEIQRAFYPRMAPDFFAFAEDLENLKDVFNEHFPTSPKQERMEEEVKATVKTFDSDEWMHAGHFAFKKSDMAKGLDEDPGFNRLMSAWEKLSEQNGWTRDILIQDPASTARMMRQHIIDTKKSGLHNAEHSLPSFVFLMRMPGPEAEVFSSEFLQSGLRVHVEA